MRLRDGNFTHLHTNSKMRVRMTQTLMNYNSVPCETHEVTMELNLEVYI